MGGRCENGSFQNASFHENRDSPGCPRNVWHEHSKVPKTTLRIASRSRPNVRRLGLRCWDPNWDSPLPMVFSRVLCRAIGCRTSHCIHGARATEVEKTLEEARLLRLSNNMPNAPRKELGEPGLINCPRCDCPLPPGEFICSVCGAMWDSVSPDFAPRRYSRIICLHCGTECLNEARTCRTCGSDLDLVCPKCEQRVGQSSRWCQTCQEDIRRLRLLELEVEAAKRARRERSVARVNRIAESLGLVVGMACLLIGGYLLFVPKSSERSGLAFVFSGLALLFLVSFAYLMNRKSAGAGMVRRRRMAAHRRKGRRKGGRF